jgi:hypothetical protein
MAALNRPVTATYAVNETVRVDTQGMAFVQCIYEYFALYEK